MADLKRSAKKTPAMTSDYLKRLDVQGHLRVKEALRKWDPIGVYGPGSTCPDDEYDSYSGAVVRFLDGGAPQKEILEYLREICVGHMCMPFDRKKASVIVDELIAFWPVWRKRLADLGPDYLSE